MAKGEQANRSEEYLYKLSLNDKFQADVLELRRILGIPSEGVKDQDDRQKCFADTTKDIFVLDALFYLQEKYKVPLDYVFHLDDFIFFGKSTGDKKFQLPGYYYSSAKILPPKHTLEPDDVDLEEFYKDHKEPYVKILVFGDSTKSEVLGYLNQNWNQVEKILTQQGWKPQKRVRKTVHKERNRLIKELYKKTKKELEKEYGTTSQSKELLISKIMDKLGYGYVDDGYIRKIGPG
ncbi:MAG: hypothetical protein WC473_01320 [Patescibacteria group bacterium]